MPEIGLFGSEGGAPTHGVPTLSGRQAVPACSWVAWQRQRVRRDALLSAPESAHQQWGGSPHRTEHWLSVAEGNCVAERRGGEQPEANDQSIINKMMNSIRPDALASLLSKGEAQNGSRPERERTVTPRPDLRREVSVGFRSAWGGWR